MFSSGPMRGSVCKLIARELLSLHRGLRPPYPTVSRICQPSHSIPAASPWK